MGANMSSFGPFVLMEAGLVVFGGVSGYYAGQRLAQMVGLPNAQPIAILGAVFGMYYAPSNLTDVAMSLIF